METQPGEWYLLARRDAQQVAALLAPLSQVGGGLLPFYDIERMARAALHILETGLHRTDAVPDDADQDEKA